MVVPPDILEQFMLRLGKRREPPVPGEFDLRFAEQRLGARVVVWAARHRQRSPDADAGQQAVSLIVTYP